MSHSLPRRHLPTLLAAVLALALAIVGGASPGHAAAADPVGSPPALTPEQAGTYYAFRTRDTGANATNEQNTRCNKHFGLRSLTTITRLNALLFSYEANAGTGRLENQTANLLGPGFICAVPGAAQGDVDAYAYSALPGTGLVEANGPCSISQVVVSGLPFILNCALAVRKDAAKGVVGGMITSNSLVNVLNRSASAPTGSVWTAHVIGSATNPGGEPGPVPPGLGAETPGLDFFVTRTRDEAQLETSPTECKRAGMTGTPLAVRQTNLAVAQPDLESGHVPDVPGATVAKMTVCYAFVGNRGYKAFAIADLKTNLGTFPVKANGLCRTVPTAAGSAFRGQACSLTVNSGPAKGGLITSNGLIEAGKPASAATSAVWTFALFGAPAAG